MKHVTVAPEYIDLLMEKMGDQFDKQLINLHRDATALDLRIANLRGQIRQAVDKIQFLSSETTIKYIEEDIEKMEAEAADLSTKRETMQPQKASDIEKTGAFVRFFLEHLDSLLLHCNNPVQQARYFGVLFDEAPRYSDLVSGTPDGNFTASVNSIFCLADNVHNTHGWG